MLIANRIFLYHVQLVLIQTFKFFMLIDYKINSEFVKCKPKYSCISRFLTTSNVHFFILLRKLILHLMFGMSEFVDFNS